MNLSDFKHSLLDSGARGPDGVDALLAEFNERGLDKRGPFVELLVDAIKELLQDASLELKARDLGLDNASHVLHHVCENGLAVEIAPDLRETCRAWLIGKRDDESTWFAYGCVLRILRLAGNKDSAFWHEEFEFWIKQFTEQSYRFAVICRAIMQIVRALGSLHLLNAADLGKLFAYGLRAESFPVHEVYAALEELSHIVNTPTPEARESLFNSVQRVAGYAASRCAMAQPVNEAGLEQMNKTLRSWRVNGLLLPTMEHAAPTAPVAQGLRPLSVKSYAPMEMAA